MKNKTFNHDIVIIFIIIIIIAGLFLLRKSDNGYLARITVNNEEYGIYDLSVDQTININDENILIIENHEIYMKEATCPDHTCIRQGHISTTGASIICLPHQLIVEIINGWDGELDGQVY